MKQINSKNHQDLIQNNKIIIVGATSNNCSACTYFKPLFSLVSSLMPGILFTLLNVDIEREATQAFKIKVLPTLLIYQNHHLIFNEPAPMTEELLVKIIKNALTNKSDLELLKQEIRELKKEIRGLKQ